MVYRDLEPSKDFEQVDNNLQIKTKKMIKVVEKVNINKVQVVALLENGVTKEEIREQLYPSLKGAQWKAALKVMGLSSYRVKVSPFVIEDMETVVPLSKGTNPNLAENSSLEE